MNKTRKLLACLVLLFVIAVPAVDVVSAALPPLAAGTFPTGTIVVPMDGKQADRIRVYGFIHEFLRSGPDLELARVIESPQNDVTMQTALTPGGTVYQGGPFLIEQKFLANVNRLLSTSDFNRVTVTRLTASFTSNQIFFVRQPTKILVVKGIWGRTDLTLTQMRINYTLVSPDDILKNPSIIDRYSLVVLDCPGWFGNPATYSPDKRAKIQTIYDKLRSRAQAGNEIIFTDIALKDLDATFPGYVQLLGPNGPGTWEATVHNPPFPAGTFPAEFPSQYYNPAPNPEKINIVTEGSGYVVSRVEPARASDVRIVIDSNKFGIPGRYAILGFYFQFGNGVVEGLAFHPQQQVPVGSPSFYAVEQIYGNKFIHGPQVDFFVSATPERVIIPQGKVANYTVTVTSVGSFSSAVNLQVSGLPATATPSFSAATVTPPQGGSVTSNLRVATTFSTPNGTYPLTITGTSTLPAITRKFNVTLVIQFAAPDFVIDVDPRPPNFLIVNLTQCKNATVSVRSVGNFSSLVNLTLTSLPAHVTFQYFPNVVRPSVGGTVSSKLQICPALDGTPGNYTSIVVSGTSMLPDGRRLTHTANLNLRLLSPPGPNPLVFLLVLLLLLLSLGLALLAAFLSRKRARGPRPAVLGPVMRVRPRPRVLHVLPLPTVRCRNCGRLMPMHAVYCPYCGRPQVVLARSPPRMINAAGVSRVTRKGIVGFSLSLVSGILVILNSAALLAPSFYGPPVNWSGIFFWLSSIGQSYAFALGVIIGLVLIMGSIVMVLRHGALADIIIFPFAVFSLIIGGGFIAGMLLGVVGGIIGALKR